ncbi:flavodoxin [Desulfosporosinus orientis DSM 765]|uniref:Flavodoxin n=1 Tax=Desulfosporosinus orientis (strain ATCC 19365 / DSM 765 / NCIMB 8382 / VKM B-1628 / Singapore I) TaxID=768706 RepID=G7WBE9_DESOD|nr:flavodoxin [Desulfosporosinus orientis DSM 765]
MDSKIINIGRSAREPECLKALIIYFSQSGNTYKIAKCICNSLKNANINCELFDINKIDKNSLSNYDLVGIGSPVFYYKEPFHVRDFLESLPRLNGQHWFVFCTHGNVLGNFFPSVVNLLKTKGASVIGFHHTYADITVPYYPRPSYTSGHPDAHDLEQANSFGMEIVKLSKDIKAIEKMSIDDFPVSSEEWIQESHRLTQNVLSHALPKLRIDSDKCIKCYACEKNCPVQGIDITIEPPRLQNPCIYCWNCVNICPTLSIDADWEPLVRMAPAYYARYKKELDKATAHSEFRWLIDPRTINFDDPLFKQRKRNNKEK